MFKTLDELEENTSAKNIERAARLFYLNKDIDFKERVRAFNKYGEHKCFIHHPANPALEKLYEDAWSSGSYDRNQTITCYWLIQDNPNKEQLAEEMFIDGVAKFDIDW